MLTLDRGSQVGFSHDSPHDRLLLVLPDKRVEGLMDIGVVALQLRRNGSDSVELGRLGNIRSDDGSDHNRSASNDRDELARLELDMRFGRYRAMHNTATLC